MRVAISVFAKAPVEGRVKTRLAATVGNRVARFFYQKMCSYVVDVSVRAHMARVSVWCTPQPHPYFRRLVRHNQVKLSVQPPGDLGQRLRRVAQRELLTADAVLLIGADAIGLTSQHLIEAVQQLSIGVDVVVAPAGDGGYTLIGMRQVQPAVFQRIPWGSAKVMRSTAARCRSAGLVLGELPLAADLDTAQDLKRWQRHQGSAFFWHNARLDRYDTSRFKSD